ncbi:MAG: SDR family oxidoreductase [SAR324 cluster bacterium]|nr:SDR family oxidoreductase [SAR324 cluster bacterium]
MKLLIAGGAGYIGSVLIPKLLDRGYDISVVDLLWFGNQLPEKIQVIQKDIMTLTEEELKGYDQVIFLAGLSNDPMAEYSPSQNFISNAAAPAFLGYIAKRAGVRRFIYAGSCSVYGYTVNKLYDEESPVTSNYPYGISKLQGESAVMQMVEDDFSVIAFRQGTVCGYSPRMRLDLIVNAMLKTAIAEKVINVNNPAIWRPILSIEDATTAYIRAIEAHEDISGIFNIASGNYTVGEVGDLVRDGVETHLEIKTKLNIQHIQDYRNYKVSIEKAISILSFKPAHDVDAIITNLSTNLDHFKDFENPSYYNIHTFKKMIG